MADNDEGRIDMHGPRWKWEWSPNTLVMLAGFASGFVAYGYAYADLALAKTQNEVEIGKLWSEVKRLDDFNRRFDTIEYRVTAVEVMARDSIAANRDTAATINSLASDTRVTREILQRLEAAAKK